MSDNAAVASLKDAGVAELYFVRHASSAPLHEEAATRADAPHDWKRDDQLRCLTAKGKDQCAAAAAGYFGAALLRCICTSPARRASETAQRMTARYETEESKEAVLGLRMVPCAHPAGMSEVAETLFETMGYGPLRIFMDAEGGKAAFTEYGSTSLKAMASAAVAEGGDGPAVALFGHAVFLNATAYAAAAAAGSSEADLATLLDMDLGETQAIVLTLEGGAVRKEWVRGADGV